MPIDLHIHSQASSDGELTAKDILKLAKESGVEAIAIADHDSVDNVDEGIYWGQKYGIEVIPACEFYTEHMGVWFHMLGYFIDHHHEDIAKLIKKINCDRIDVIDRQIAKLMEAGFYLDKNKVLEYNPLPLLLSYAKAIFADPRNENNPVLNNYENNDTDIMRFTVECMIPGKPFNAHQYTPQAVEIMQLIKKCGGISVMAHPSGIPGREKADTIIDSLTENGLNGMEVYTNWHTEADEEYYLKYCKEHNLLITCGSDFHGKAKPHIKLGQVRNNTYEVVRNLKNFRQKK